MKEITIGGKKFLVPDTLSESRFTPICEVKDGKLEIILLVCKDTGKEYRPVS